MLAVTRAIEAKFFPPQNEIFWKCVSMQKKTSTAIEIDTIVEFCMKNLHSLVSDRVVRN